MNLSELKDKYQSAHSGLNKMLGVQELLIEDKKRLFLEISNHNEFLDNKDEVQDVLHELQKRTQSRTKEIYENLLTSLLKDVMPDNEECDRVILNTGVKNNKTTLSVEVAAKNGAPRDVYHDKGGSVENIMAMGLRYIALSRTSNRRFIILDEADAWLKNIYIPAFAEVLCQLSRRIGIQVVYISHHSVENFVGKAKIINLTREKGIVITEEMNCEDAAQFEGVDDDSIPDLMDGVGIRHIRLVNFKQHENTLLKLSPNVTIITGDNDIGKSTVLQAIDAVSSNSGRDGLIRDGQPYCRVEIGLEDDLELTWSYKAKGAKRTFYNLTDDENISIKSSDSGTDIPSWLHDYLAMPLHHDFDLHIGDQHNASFILDKKISVHKKAEILSLGKEASKVQKMITLHGERVRLNKQDLKRKSEQLNDIKNKLLVLRKLSEQPDIFKEIDSIVEYINSSKSRLSGIVNKAKYIEKLTERTVTLEKVNADNALEIFDSKSESNLNKMSRLIRLSDQVSAFDVIANLELMTIPVLIDTYKMGSTVSRIDLLEQSIQGTAKVDSLMTLDIFKTTDVDKILNVAKSANLISQKVSSLFHILEIDDVRLPTDNRNMIDRLTQVGSNIGGVTSKIKNLLGSIKNTEVEKNAIQSEYDNFVVSIGGICPTCNSQICHEHTLAKEGES